MTFTITVESPHRATETFKRANRDGAEYLFRRLAYDALKACALLDRPIAHRVMERAEEASQPDCAIAAVHVMETTIRFRAVA